jgi:hypothetical protein
MIVLYSLAMVICCIKCANVIKNEVVQQGSLFLSAALKMGLIAFFQYLNSGGTLTLQNK